MEKIRNSIFLCVSAGLFLLPCIAAAQTEKKLTARELFYTPLPDAKPAAAVNRPAPAASKPAPAKTVHAASKPPSNPAGEKPKPEAPQRTSDERPSYVQRVSTDTGYPPLALRYSLLKLNSEGAYVEVDPDTTFRSGDKIKVAVEANDTAYLYIVQQGSSKAWNVLFPNDDTGSGSNRIERTKRYTIPGGGRFTFDEQPGTERLFVVLSRRAEPDLENIIYDLSKKGSAAPAATPPSDSGAGSKMILAQSRIDDSLVNRFRSQMISRDLVFEKVNDEKPAASKKMEKAMYYATPDRSAAARIVIDLNLRHQ